MSSDRACVGVDGAKSGWIAVWRDHGSLAGRVYATAREVVAAHDQAKVIAVDIPIGLSQSGRRQADVEARKFVGGHRACSVFATPVRGILDATTRAEACRRHRQIDGRGFGAQSFAILPKIREWDTLLLADEAAQRVVREIHPEVCFAALNGGAGQGMRISKKTPAGAAARIQLLRPVFGRDEVEQLVRDNTHGMAAIDDVLDALVALWSAERMASGTAKSLPERPEPDASGLKQAIHY